ncbi:MAG TPA: PEP-CTERM sorting domain-containing protein [Terriglobia bacterium]|nr:PEP-CTERM sorting domain-containing protein [Terriglobia bacterium]
MRRILFFALCVTLFSANGRAGTVLFYSGPDELTWGPDGLLNISLGYAVTDPFNLPSASTVGEIGFSGWINPGYVPATVSWAITTTPGLSNVLASGTAASLTNSLTATGRGPGYPYINDVYWNTFDVNVPLAAGTYWLWLTDGAPSAGGLGWGYASNSGVSEDFFSNGTLNFVGTGTQSFALYGPAPSTVPEPGTLALTASALLGAVGFLRRKLSL